MYLRNQEGQLVPENVSTGPSVTGPSVLSHWIISLISQLYKSETTSSDKYGGGGAQEEKWPLIFSNSKHKKVLIVSGGGGGWGRQGRDVKSRKRAILRG